MRVLLIISLLWLSWLVMMLVHEAGHVLGAVATGGRVVQVVWHPAAISRTDVAPNPHPAIEVWCGPVLGVVVPLLVAVLSQCFRMRAAYLLWSIAGFCLIANGAYLGLGYFDPVGDAADLIRRGTPPWVLASFGVLATAGGLWIWHRVSPRFGFGRGHVAVDPRDVRIVVSVALALTGAGLAVGNRGAH